MINARMLPALVLSAAVASAISTGSADMNFGVGLTTLLGATTHQ